MFERNIKELRNLYNKIGSYNEETIKDIIVIPFLINLGYKEEWIHCEKHDHLNIGRVDISISINGNKDNMLFVEVKKGNETLNSKHCSQLVNYLSTENIEWGILTNGNCYILINKNINGKSTEKEIIRYYLKTPKKEVLKKYRYFPQKNNNNLKYLSYKYLFKNETTYYFKYLKDYMLTLKNDHSSRQYESTLYNYFNYLSEYKKKYDLRYIHPDSFKEYLLYCINDNISSKSIKSKETIINKYAYVRAFYDMIAKQKSISNPFKDLSENDMFDDIIKDIPLEKIKTDIPTLNNDEIALILKSYDNSRETIRNKLIFLLFLYTGLDIKEIRYLKLKDIDHTKNKIKVDNRSIPIPKSLMQLIDTYLEIRKKDKVKCDYLICCKYAGKYNVLTDGNYNKIISQKFNKITEISEDRKKHLTPSFIKSSLIRKMYQNGVNLETISYFTGLTIFSVLEYLSEDDISKKINYKKVINKHPYKEFFQDQNKNCK